MEQEATGHAETLLTLTPILGDRDREEPPHLQELPRRGRKLLAGFCTTKAYNLANAYTVYIQTDKHTYDMRYQFGELLYKIKEYDAAFGNT